MYLTKLLITVFPEIMEIYQAPDGYQIAAAMRIAAAETYSDRTEISITSGSRLTTSLTA